MLEQSLHEQKWLNSSTQVMVVEDDPAINSLLAMVLEESGYQVKIAWNGLEALDYLKQTREEPALILLDLSMPIMDGKQFLEALQTGNYSTQNIPVIVLTASRQTVAVDRKTGVVGYLAKPFDLDELISYVEKFAPV